MTSYMSRLFSRSNSSFLLRSGNALEAKVTRLIDETYLVDAGLGRPRTALANELIKIPDTTGPSTFTTKVGFLNPLRGESRVKNLLLQRCFVDLVTGDTRTKLQAASRLNEMIGPADAAAGGGGDGERPLLLPRKFRKQQAYIELRNMWRSNKKVKGFIAAKVRGGYSVGIAGYLAFVPFKQMANPREGDRFVIESITPKNIVVAKVGQIIAFR